MADLKSFLDFAPMVIISIFIIVYVIPSLIVIIALIVCVRRRGLVGMMCTESGHNMVSKLYLVHVIIIIQ